MLKLSASVCIDAPPANVWACLARLEDITLWAEPILRASCDGSVTRGVGARRTCALRGGITLRERWSHWIEGETFTYEGAGLPGVKFASNTWSVRAEGQNQTLLTTEATVVLKGGCLGLALEPLMRIASNRMSARSLAAFKYLVEHGRPFAGKHSRLPRVPAAC